MTKLAIQNQEPEYEMTSKLRCISCKLDIDPVANNVI